MLFRSDTCRCYRIGMTARLPPGLYSKKQGIRLVVSTLQILSFRRLEPVAMIYSDRGCIYPTGIFRDLVSRMGPTHNFSRTGNCHDNATMECSNWTFKVEALYKPGAGAGKARLQGADRITLISTKTSSALLRDRQPDAGRI